MAADDATERKRRRGVVDDSDSEAAPAPRVAEAVPDASGEGTRGGADAAPRRQRGTHAKARPAQKASKIEDTEKYAYDVLNMMKDAYRRDLQANREGKPALLRLHAIDEIAQRVVRRETQEACIKLGVLREIRTWLEPLPDMSLPSQKIKKALLDLLYNMHVSKYDLVSSEVGKIVHFYARCSKEAKDVRKMAHTLMAKWKALIIREEVG